MLFRSSRPFREALAQRARLEPTHAWLRQCPRVHLKTIIVDGEQLYLGSANLTGAGLGLIIGGALGNAADRAVYGAVVDFLDLHWFDRHFFVFNVADAAISAGVAMMIVDGLFGDERARRR